MLRCAVVAASWALTPFPVFAGASLYVYFVPSFQPFKFIWSFLVFLALGWVLSGIVGSAAVFGVTILIGIALYLLLGAKDLLFIHRQAAAFSFAGILFVGLFFSFFSALRPSLFGASGMIALIVFALFLLFKELFPLFLPSLAGQAVASRAITGASAILAFVIAQVLWILSFLPLSSISASLLMTVITILGIEAMFDGLPAQAGLQNKLSRQRIIMLASFGVFLIGVILLSTKWTV